MTTEAALAALVRINLVASVAIVLVLVLRPVVLRRLGASVVYWLWLVVPIAAAASVLPARERVMPIRPVDIATVQAALDAGGASQGVADRASAEVVSERSATLPAGADVLLAVWLLGAVALLARSISGTRRFAADPTAGPALVGVFRPRLVLPPDFRTRFDSAERELILAHEETHRVSGHTLVNALTELMRCASWFNPLVHMAVVRVRADQELACDAAVIAAHPNARRVYAQALLKTQVAPAYLPLGCTWSSRSGRRLGERITMLGRPSPGRWSTAAGASTVAAVGVALGYGAWAQQPERLVREPAARPDAVWTRAADAPEGVLSHALEGRRHDLFIELAQNGGIDIVFFGTTDTEMWWWNRGKAVWEAAFGLLRAANFGSQGTAPDSLLWRMRNGELDGYRAKLIVLQTWGSGGPAVPDERRAETLAGYEAVLDEIRARQPQAKVLIFAAFPRGQAPLEAWRQISAENARALAGLVDDETVFYADIGERFFRADGTFRREMWSLDLNNRGAQAPAFEAWAEALQPWIDRFVR